MVKAVKKGMRGAPEPGAPASATGHSPRILFMTAFTIDFSRFDVHFSFSAWVLRRDSISAHIWYGLRTILAYTLPSVATEELSKNTGLWYGPHPPKYGFTPKRVCEPIAKN